MTARTLRPAVPQDAPALARLHHRVWTETYAGLAPPQAIAALTEAHRLTGWTATLARSDIATLIALHGDMPIGLVCFGAASDPVFAPLPEIRHLYLLPAHRGQGLGRRLLYAALDALRAVGHPGAALAVVEQNLAARAFYARAGGTEDHSFIDKGPLWRSTNRLVTWTFSHV